MTHGRDSSEDYRNKAYQKKREKTSVKKGKAKAKKRGKKTSSYETWTNVRTGRTELVKKEN
jgi:hypothetical protein